MSSITNTYGEAKSSNPTTSQRLRRSQALRKARAEAGLLIGESCREVAVKWIAKRAFGHYDALVKKLTSNASPVEVHPKISGSDARRSGFTAEGQKNWPCNRCGTESSIYALYGGKGEDSGLGKGQSFKRRGLVYCAKCETSTCNVVETIAMLRGDDHSDPEVIDGVIEDIFASDVIDAPPPLSDKIDWSNLEIDFDDEPNYRVQFNLVACERELKSKKRKAEQIAVEMEARLVDAASPKSPKTAYPPLCPVQPAAKSKSSTQKMGKKKPRRKKKVTKNATKETPDIHSLIVKFAAMKKMPPESFVAFGAAVAKDRHGEDEIRVPLWYPEPADAVGVELDGVDLDGYFRMSLGSPEMMKGKIKWHAKHGLFLPGRRPQPGEAWHLVEGVKDAAAMHGAGYVNTAGLSTKCFAGLFKSRLPAMFNGCHVILVPDRDRAAANKVSENRQALLDAGAASVKVAVLSFPIVESKGPDVRDYIAEFGEEKLRELVAAAAEYNPNDWQLSDSKGRPKIRNSKVATKEIIGTILRELAKREDLFVREGRLVESYVDCSGELRLMELKQTVLPSEINEVLDFGPAGVPKWAAPHVHGHSHKAHHFGIRVLDRVSSAPVLRADGSIIRDGYDPELRVLVKSSQKYPALPQMDREPLLMLDPLWKLIEEFPWLNDEQDQAAFLAEVVTEIVPHLFTGRPPLFVHEANVEGAGKSLLASLGHIIATGFQPSFLAYQANQEELRKTITSMLMRGEMMILLDNADAEIGGAVMDMFLTAEIWCDRILGGNEPYKATNQAMMIVTTNSATFTPDTLRRTLPVRLNITDSAYKARTFRIENLLAEAQQRHHNIYMRILACLHAYIAAGAPLPPSEMTLASFEGWSRFVGGFVEFCDLPSPLSTRDSLQQASTVNDVYDTVIAAFRSLDRDTVNGSGMTASQIVREFEKAERPRDSFSTVGKLTNGNSSDALREMIEAIGMSGNRPSSRTLAWALVKLSKRPRTDYRIEVTEGRAKQFKLVDLNPTAPLTIAKPDSTDAA
ncbi:hypothetical protein Mal15_19540 [Stieleria maiorica]|uniref:Uncharacterized protein n=1 Tax=Stieleria maiorica TaxID=2795974 RepID=A0A5B9M9W9_9BACT|nr:hypothetical protein [Stieleria maiorica]QEF97908.1 hypothetical protein Mal15_19540 [Stieleria maiorica]